MSTAPKPSATSAEGTLIAGRYRLQKLLARGGMGEVFAAVDESSQCPVALKRMLPEVLEKRSGDLGFAREYHVLSELRHPRIIEVYDYGVDQGLPYFTMELLDGQDLRELAPLPLQKACAHLRDVASSLALLHARRLLHRDLSPRNVRCTSDGRCKLIDFGTMTPFGEPPNVAGTAPMVPPEALRGAGLDSRSDLYSLGALAYYLLTGRHGYAAKDFKQLPAAFREPLARPSKFAPGIPTALDDLVMSMMSLNVMLRPRTAAEVIDLLSAIGELPRDDSDAVVQSFVTSVRLVGRVEEQQNLERRIEHALQGKGSTLLVCGEHGTGRSRLLEEAVHMAQTRGLLTVQATAHGERGAHTLVDTLFDALERSAPDQARTASGMVSMRMPVDDETSRGDASAPTGEARARLQASMTRWFCEVAQQRPLLVAIDDVDRADELSASFVASLAHEARRFPLLVVATRADQQVDGAFSALASLRKAAGIITLRVLERDHCNALVSSIFGDVPNLDRLSEWLFRNARGNPGLTVELAEHLIARGVVRYVAGTWVLPDDAIHEAVPSDLTQTLGLRVLHVGRAARSLAELMSVRRGGLSFSLALAVGELDLSELFAAFDELVRGGIIEVAGNEYVFVQQAMRESVRQTLLPERASKVHGLLAHALLKEPDDDAQLEAGWHLVHTQDELRGAALLARIGPRLVDEGLNVARAIPAIEKALAVFERRNWPLQERLRLRSRLVMAGYLYDYRLGFRYGDETVSTLYRYSGLPWIARLARYLGGPLATLTVVAALTMRRYFTPRRVRAPSVAKSIQYFTRSAIALMGLRATGLDAPGTAALLPRLRALAAIPQPLAAAAVARTAIAFALQPLGREAELHDAVVIALRMCTEGRLMMMLERERQDLLTGLLLVDGINECYRENSQALERAELLEARGTQLASASAKRIRMIYHTVRGARELADRERRALDLHGIQGGTTWQVEWFTSPIEGIAGTIYGDLLAVRRALDRLEAMLAYVPSLEPMRDQVRIAYHYRRGEYAHAVEFGKSFVAKYPPRTIIGWGPTYAMMGLALCELDQAQEALALCERGLAELTEADHAYFVMYSPLHMACAVAWAYLGDRTKANELFGAQLSRLQAAGELAALAAIHDQRARVARRLNDRMELHSAVRDMRREALATGNAALIASADQWSETYERLSRSSLPPRPERATPESDTDLAARRTSAEISESSDASSAKTELYNRKSRHEPS